MVVIPTLISVCFNLVTALFLGLALVIKRSAFKQFAIFNLSIALWSFLYIFWILSSNATIFMIVARLLLISIIIIPFSFLKACYEIAGISEPFFVRICSIAGLVFFSVLSFTPVMISGIYSPKIGFQFWPIAGPAFPAYLAYFALNFSWGHWILFQNRLRKRFVIPLGTIIAFIGGSVNFFLWYKLEIPPYPNILVGIYAIYIFFVVTKHELLDIKLIVTRSAAYLVTLCLFAAGYFGLIVWPYLALINPHIDWAFLVASITYGGVIVGLYFHRVQRFIQTSAYKKFLSFTYDLQDTLKKASSVLVQAQTQDDVLQAILTVQTNLEIDDSYSLLRTKDHSGFEFSQLNTFQKMSQDMPEGIRKIKAFALEDPLILTCDTIENVKRYTQLDPNTQKELQAYNIHKKSLLLAIHSHKKLQAIFILGQKLSEEDYSEEELSLFEIMLNQAISIFDRIAHQENLLESNKALQSANATVSDLNITLNRLNLELEKRVEDGIEKQKLALAAAQELAKKAQLSTLTMGIAHEIRNPLSAMKAKATHLRDKLTGKLPLLQASESGGVEIPFAVRVTRSDLAAMIGGESVETLWESFVENKYISEEGEINEAKFKPFSPIFELELPETVEKYRKELSAYLVKVFFDAQILSALTVFDDESSRVERICNNMLKYGMSGQGVSKTDFAEFVGNTDSEKVWAELVANGYLNENGMLEDKFNPLHPGFSLGLSPKYQPFEAMIIETLNKSEKAKKTELDLNKCLGEMQVLFDGKFKSSNITISHELDPQIPHISGHFDDLRQALMNLYTNAYHAILAKNNSEYKQFIVRTKLTDNQVELQLADTGCGIPKDILPKIMDPFFSTKSLTGGKNIGLGLSIVNQTVQRFGGKIIVESEEGVGTTFRLFFPGAAPS